MPPKPLHSTTPTTVAPTARAPLPEVVLPSTGEDLLSLLFPFLQIMSPTLLHPCFAVVSPSTAPSPLFETGTKRKRVGVIGVGGLGHMAILFVKAMGAEVTAISRTDAKREDAFKLGATNYFATGNNLQEAVKAHSRSLDFILCTISKSSSMDFHSSLYVDFVLSDPENFPIADYLPLLTPTGIFCIVGVIPTPLQVPAFPLIMHSACIAGSNIGSPKEIAEMFQFAVKHNIKPWIQKWNFDDINKALPSFQKGDPRYRFVLVNVDNGGKI